MYSTCRSIMPAEPVIWVVDDDPSIRWVLSKAFTKAGFTARNFAAAADALARLADHAPAAVFTDLRMPGTGGLALMQALHDRRPDIPVVVMTAYSDLDSAVASYRGGAFEHLPKPFDLDDAVALVRRALAARAVNGSEPRVEPLQTPAMLGAAPAIQEVFRVIGRLSQSTMTVLIRGESGTGKELVARALYDNSPRAGHPFIAINTAAIPSELLESELFGHERGAFTGAHAQRKGRFEQADGGTLFLDEIGDMPAALQTRLLRVLSEGRFYRVGGHQQIAVDVRVIAATNQDLEARVDDGRFRADLYHRLNVVQITVPALRARRDDIAPLAARFLGDAARELGTEPKTLGADALACCMAYDWPGNVRELENLCRRVTVMAPGQTTTAADLPAEMQSRSGPPADDWQTHLRRHVAAWIERGEPPLLASLQPQFERLVIETALAATSGHKQEAARRLGWGRNTLARKMKDLGLA